MCRAVPRLYDPHDVQAGWHVVSSAVVKAGRSALTHPVSSDAHAVPEEARGWCVENTS